MLQIEFEKEDDGRWIAEIPLLPGVMAYGAWKEYQAMPKTTASPPPPPPPAA